VVNEDVICRQYLTFTCSFGRKCRNKHVSDAERDELIKKFASIPCRFGAHCRTDNCLYQHPQRKVVDPKRLMEMEMEQRLEKQKQQQEQYQQKLREHQKSLKNRLGEQSAVAAQPISQNHHATFQSNTNEMARGQQQQGPTKSPPGSLAAVLNGDAPAWTPSSMQSSSSRNSSATPVSTNPTEGFFTGQSSGVNQVHDIWSSSNTSLATDPWSTASLGQMLSNTSSVSAQQYEQEDVATLNFAERLKLSNANPPRRPQHQSSGPFLPVTSNKRAPQFCKIPQQLWVDYTSRSAKAFNISDPLERFKEVNSVHNHAGVLDMHFQSRHTCDFVLDKVLASPDMYEVDEDDPTKGYVWIVTGSGHHTTQRLHKLFDLVQDYLDQHSYFYKIGKDSKGHQGAFYVRVQKQV